MHGEVAYPQQLATDWRIVAQAGGSIENRQVAGGAGVDCRTDARGLRTVRELQTLDAGQVVDAITTSHQVGDGHRVAINHHAVVGGHP
ncbi:hypothetical protein D3C75_1137780 [compost metagenome]